MSSPSELSLHRARDAQSPVEGPPRAGDCPQCLADADSFTPHDSAVMRVISAPIFQMGTPALASLNHTRPLAETGPGVRSQSLPSSSLRCDGPGRARLHVTRAFRRPVTACPSRGRPASERGCRAERLPEISLCIWALAHTVLDKADRFLLGFLVGLKRHHPLPQQSLAQRSSLTKSPRTKPPPLYFLSWHSEFLCIALTAKRLITY